MYLIAFFNMRISFSLFARQRKRNAPKEKESTPLFSSSSLRSAEFFIIGLSAQPTLASQTPYGQTVLGIFFPPQWGRVRVGANCERVRSTIASIRDSALAEQKNTAERSEDVENSASFLLFLVSFFLLWLASKEEKKYKSKKIYL